MTTEADVWVGRCRECGAINAAILIEDAEFIAEMVNDGLAVTREPGPVALSDCAHAAASRGEA